LSGLGKKLRLIFGYPGSANPQPIAKASLEPAKEEPPQAEAVDELAEQVAVIEGSLLFDEKWYIKTHEFGEYLNAAEHYLTVGWKEGLNPSPFFYNEEYFELYPDVRETGMNPLLHFELYGAKEGRYMEQITRRRKEIAAANPDCTTDMQGGYLRLRITNACNAKCRYCGARNTYGSERDHAMEPKWYYEYLRPLYDKLNMVMVTGGDAFVAKESHNYLKFMCEKYPKITLHTESNGIAFGDDFQKLAAENLFKTHFSVNASCAEVFERSCWEGEGGKPIYEKLLGNIQKYVGLLKDMGRECFSPSFSMVINRDNVGDILNFTRLALKNRAWYICFFFDYSENDMTSDYFAYPEESREALKTLMEIERVLAGRVMFYFRLWIPGAEIAPAQKIVEAEHLSDLEQKYRDLLELSEGRSVVGEWNKRNEFRRAAGKYALNMDEDFAPTVRLERGMCFAPWGELDLYPSGRLDFCGWFEPTLSFEDYLVDGHIDFESLFNSFAYMSARKRILRGNFRGCQVCCPMNSVKNPIAPVMKYGLDRLTLR